MLLLKSVFLTQALISICFPIGITRKEIILSINYMIFLYSKVLMLDGAKSSENLREHSKITGL